MSERLDRLLQALQDQPSDNRLNSLEAAVWERLEAGGAAPGAETSLLAIRAAAVVGFLCVGFTAGGVAAATADVRGQEISVFSAGVELAPSTLLERP